ncbi:hypothetical protein BSNK01_05210 [Bacillaceae bacterium]
MNVAIYVRADDAEEVQHEVELLKKYAQSPEVEWEIKGIYVDEGGNDYDPTQNEGFRQLVEDANLGRYHLLLIYDLDRISKNELIASSAINHFQAKGIEVITFQKTVH